MAKGSFKFALGRSIGSLVVRKFNFKCDDLSYIEGPYLLLSNHTTDYDPIFVSIAMKKPIRFVASEHSMHKGFISKLMKSFTNPIIHQKGKVGIATTKEILRAIKAGDNVGLFPEGGRSFNGETQEILSSTAKLVKSTKAALVTVKIIGGYEVQPRWGLKLNKGNIRLELSGIYSPEDVKAMSDDELMEMITKDLYVKANVPSDLTGIESVLFMASKDDIHPNMDIAALDKMQREYVYSGAGDFSDQVDLYEVGDDHVPRLIKKGYLSANKDGFKFDGETLNVSGIAAVSRNTLILHQEDQHLEVQGDTSFSALKYIYQYDYLEKKDK